MSLAILSSHGRKRQRKESADNTSTFHLLELRKDRLSRNTKKGNLGEQILRASSSSMLPFISSTTFLSNGAIVDQERIDL